jgi:Lon protease-like protein
VNPGVDVDDLPRVVYLFPLDQLLLLPKTHLGFEVSGRWFCDLLDAAEAAGGFVGVVQSREKEREPGKSGTPLFYQVGCLGRLRIAGRNEDGHQIHLTGLIRFRIVEERLGSSEQPFPLAEVDYGDYRADLVEGEEEVEGLDLASFKAGLLQAIAKFDPNLHTERIQSMTGHEVLRSLIQVVRLTTAEKQTILEAKGLKEMSEAFFLLLAMNFLTTTRDPSPPGRVH